MNIIISNTFEWKRKEIRSSFCPAPSVKDYYNDKENDSSIETIVYPDERKSPLFCMHNKDIYLQG